jgi:hypothetical protein
MEFDYPEILLEALGRAPSLIAVLGAFLTTHENQTAGNDNRLGTDWRVAKIDSFGCWLSLAPGFLVRAKLKPRLDRAIVSLISLK